MMIFSGCSPVVSDADVVDFDTCAQAGFPVMESYPRQCRGPTGELHVEIIEDNVQ